MLSGKMYRFRVPDGVVHPEYLESFLRSHDAQAAIDRMKTGISDSGLNLTHARFLRLPVRIAPAGEQRRIADAVETDFSRLDEAEAALERVQRNLKRYRAAVLQAAVEGRLVPTEAELARAEGRDYEPASELLKRILAERRRRWEEAELPRLKAAGKAPRDDRWKAKYEAPVSPDTCNLPHLPEGWCWTTTEAVAEVVDPQPSHRTPPEVGGGLPYIGMGDVQDGVVRPDRARRVGSHVLGEHRSRYSLRDGDFVFGKIGTLGRPALLPRPFDYALSANLVLVQPDLNMARAFHFYWMQSAALNRIVTSNAQSTSQPAFGIKKVRALPVPLAPLPEQQRIVEEIERQLSIQLATVKLLNGHLAHRGRLRQAILKWAFEGKLVDQDPNDEPASILLERIRSERAQTDVEKPRAGRGRPRKGRQGR
jgi:type I restriction enzyme S subunit